MTFVYINQITKETYELSGIVDRQHAWKLVKFAAERNGWNEFDIVVKCAFDISETVNTNFNSKPASL
jgi:hypothetical protein